MEIYKNDFKLICKNCGKHFGHCNLECEPIYLESTSSIQITHNIKTVFFCSEKCCKAYYNKSKDDGN